MAIPVKLPVFEGPLDLLMHLIEKNKIDIYDIPIVEITGQYLEYVRQMDHEDMDVTSEFLVMAATLLDIKSRMLLPREKDPETGEEEEDPREELVQRLLEYKMFKYLSEELAVRREEAGVRYFREKDLPKEVRNYQPPIDYSELLGSTDLQNLKKVFGEVLRRKKSLRDPIRSGFGKIRREQVNMDTKMLYIRAYLQTHPRTDFRALLESGQSREEVIVTFLILLELMKTQKICIIQDSIGGKILVEAAGSLHDSDTEDSADLLSDPADSDNPRNSETGDPAAAPDSLPIENREEDSLPADPAAVQASAGDFLPADPAAVQAPAENSLPADPAAVQAPAEVSLSADPAALQAPAEVSLSADPAALQAPAEDSLPADPAAVQAPAENSLPADPTALPIGQNPPQNHAEPLGGAASLALSALRGFERISPAAIAGTESDSANPILPVIPDFPVRPGSAPGEPADAHTVAIDAISDTPADLSPAETVEADILSPAETVEADVLSPVEAVESDVLSPAETVEADVLSPVEADESDVLSPAETNGLAESAQAETDGPAVLSDTVSNCEEEHFSVHLWHGHIPLYGNDRCVRSGFRGCRDFSSQKKTAESLQDSAMHSLRFLTGHWKQERLSRLWARRRFP